MPSQWNMFVKKIYEEGKSKDSNYEFKQALKDASKRKSEMGKMSSSVLKSKRKSSKSKEKSIDRRRKSRKMSMSCGKTRRKTHKNRK